MPLRIWLLEDDEPQADVIIARLTDAYGSAGLALTYLRTEAEFVSQLDQSGAAPDVFIIDMLVRWTDPAPEAEMVPTPDEVQRDGYYRAGLRCIRRLRAKKETERSPVVLYTVLDRADLEPEGIDAMPNVSILGKEGDLDALVTAIDRVTKHRR